MSEEAQNNEPNENRMMQANKDEDAAKAVVLDFLIKRGMKDAAAAFAREALLEFSGQETMIIERYQIKLAILDDRAVDALETINKMFPEILEEDKRLLFRIKHMHFIHLVRTRHKQEAVEYARNEKLEELTVGFPELRESLDNSLTLLIFPSPKKGTPLARFYSREHRAMLANSVNDAILKTLGIQQMHTNSSLF